ncbi:phosphoadenosine phosphosulfate reductase [Citreimonas salinaria]|uniref:Phosphoadenosine phosphosulfate reductase n=1 Tax=Citreimonas salinaria TaxID=321339 RepID=A0A1H3GB60_9RHOB|nr:phosphoadenosine phosphosulfate reductase [Citreimonas salinaria]SDY00280.1 hypothetical protein SAMN05444340_102247 [Citreimonas salinaria]
MHGTLDGFPPDLSQMAQADWWNAMRGLGRRYGFDEPLGQDHAGIFVEQGDTLLVSFETVPGIRALSPTHTPLGLDMLRRAGWSSLVALASADTWFRDQPVYDFFDQLTDDGFFDDFERVIFYGAGPCGYAAGAYSVAAPGARVLLLQPQASLDPRVADWDDRFVEQRRRDFTSRYGFAPDMIDGTMATHLLFDPRERLDAMHAALFERPGVTRHRLPFMGGALQSDLAALDLIAPLLEAVAEDRLDTATMARLWRARRDHPPYLRRLLARLDSDGRDGLTRLLCRNVTQRMHAPRFQRRLAQLDDAGDGSDGL